MIIVKRRYHPSRESSYRCANWARSWVLMILGRWIGIRTTVCSAVMGAAAGVIALSIKGYSAGLIGFSIGNCIYTFLSTLCSRTEYVRSCVFLLGSFYS